MRWNYHNYREACEVDGCYVLDHELLWLADPDVMYELKVDTPYVDCSDDVYDIMIRRNERTDAGVFLTHLLNSRPPVLAYNGDLDVICNYMSGQVWTSLDI